VSFTSGEGNAAVTMRIADVRKRGREEACLCFSHLLRDRMMPRMHFPKVVGVQRLEGRQILRFFARNNIKSAFYCSCKLVMEYVLQVKLTWLIWPNHPIIDFVMLIDDCVPRLK
jgi:hypothetical protein